MSKVDVAIGLLFCKGKVLVGWREAKQHQGNKHEFAGGKVEQGETPRQACEREILEETGLHITNWHAWDTICHEYEDLTVTLHLFYAHTHQTDVKAPWQWYERDELLNLNFPKANDAILKRLQWKKWIKITDQFEQSEQALVYWRTNVELADQPLANLIVNVDVANTLPLDQQKQLGAVHLSHTQLLQTSSLRTGIRYIAACHDAQSLQHAEKIGCDAVLLSPVLATKTHPKAVPLGWEKFTQLAQQSNLLVFALGGLSPQQNVPCYGVAGISQFKAL